MNPYFMKKAVESSTPLEKMKFVITNTISAFYYISMFLKPVFAIQYSLTRSSDRPCRLITTMALKSTASKSRIIHQLATSWLWVLREVTDTMAATTSQPMQA